MRKEKKRFRKRRKKLARPTRLGRTRPQTTMKTSRIPSRKLLEMLRRTLRATTRKP